MFGRRASASAARRPPFTHFPEICVSQEQGDVGCSAARKGVKVPLSSPPPAAHQLVLCTAVHSCAQLWQGRPSPDSALPEGSGGLQGGS